MVTSKGQQVRITLELSGAEQLHPAWLVAALAGSYPGGDVVSMVRQGPAEIVVTLRARKPFEISVGDVVRPLAEGLPGEFVTHSATVTAVELDATAAAPTDVSAPAGATKNDLLKLLLASALIGTVAYAIHRIGDQT